MFSIDGITWPYRCAIERSSQLKASDISGLMMDGSYFNDLLGTYMQYTIMIAVPLTDRDSITPLYEMLSDPVDGHVFVLPYNQSTVTITARVEGSVNDVFVNLPNGAQYWKGLQFTIIANHPSKEYTLSQVLTRGRAPLPDVAKPSVGDSYTWDGTKWMPFHDYAKYVLDMLLESGFDFTNENYVPMMKLWFSLNGAAPLTDFSDLCEEWFSITRTGWTGGTQFYHASQSSVSTGTKVGDNSDMSVTPSTNTTKGQDDYQDVPLFHCLDCNWVLDAKGKPHITAIDGVCGNFERNNPDKLVGVLQMTGWHMYVEDAEAGTYTHMYTDVVAADGYKPLPEAVDLDGTFRAWVVHAKYAAGDDYCCYSGARPWTYSASHNSAITNFHTKHGSQYGGKTSADDAFLKLMFFLKYANLSADGILEGCVAYNFQYAVAVQETGVERVILTAAQAANIRVGSTVMVGNPTAFSSGTTLNVDRNKAGMRAKVDRKKVVSKETVEGGNVAINIDNGGTTFDTTANTITTTGDAPTYISTSPWYTGSTDDVKGADGSPSTPGNGTEPVKLQGIEYAMGAYEVVSDCILKYRKDSNDKYWLGVYVCRDASKYSTSLTADYELVDYEVECPSSSGWQYISELGFDSDHPEVWFPHLIGCTSSQRTKDAIYILASSESVYEWLSLGTLSSGVGGAGLSVVDAITGLSRASWSILARLSATGNRGELTFGH